MPGSSLRWHQKVPLFPCLGRAGRHYRLPEIPSMPPNSLCLGNPQALSTAQERCVINIPVWSVCRYRRTLGTRVSVGRGSPCSHAPLLSPSLPSSTLVCVDSHVCSLSATVCSACSLPPSRVLLSWTPAAASPAFIVSVCFPLPVSHPHVRLPLSLQVF